MLRLATMCAAAFFLLLGSANAHEGHAAECLYGNTRHGPMYHYHDYRLTWDGAPVRCGGQGRGGPGYGGGYYEAPPPPRRDYYGGGGYGRPGDYGPQTNRGQDCYNVYGRRICCPKGWTVQDGRCAPYRGY